MSGTRVMKKEAPKKRPGAVLVAAAGIALGAYLALCAWLGDGTMLPNTTLGGLDVSGMTQEQAQSLLVQQLEEHQDDAVLTLTSGSWSGTITGAQLQANANGELEIDQVSFFARGFRYIKSQFLGGETRLSLDLYDREQYQPELEQLLDQAARAIGCEVGGATYEVQGDQLVVTKGKTGLAIDREVVRKDVYAAFEDVIFPGVFAQTPAEKAVELTLDETAPETPNFEAVAAQLCTQPVDATIDPATCDIIPHVNGVNFTATDLQAAYQKAAEGQQFSIPVELVTPEETAESLRGKLFANLLGEGASRVGGSANRKTNVKLSAQACNGVVLMPGEEFSYNNTTGSRTADKGYLAAPVYSGSESVDEVGGGICQTSSTIYYAVLHSTLEVVERRAHRFATGYVPDGMDATVYFGSTDFRFKNNTDYPVKIVTETYTKNGNLYLQVRLYGTNESGRYAKPERVQYDWEEPTTTYVAKEEIPRGTTEVDQKQNPYTGLKAQTYRYIYEKDGTLVEKQDMGVSHYKMRTRTIYYNPQDGDPKTWVDGKPPKPVAEPVTPTTPTEQTPPPAVQIPETPVPEVPVPETPVPEVPVPEAPMEPIPEHEIPVDPD